VNESLFAAWVAGDRDAYLALFAPDFRAQIHELGSNHAPFGDRNATADVLFGPLAIDRSHATPNRLVAIRGDDLALIATTFHDGNSTATMYTLSEVRDGRVVRADTFAQDQLHEALAELERRWMVLGAPTGALEGLLAMGLASATGDWRGFRALLAADFEATPRSRMAIPDRQSADAYTEWVRQMSVDGGGVSFVLADIPAISERFAMTRMHIDAADGSGWRTWLVWTWDDGRAIRVDPYDIDDADAARARFEELNGGGSTATSELVSGSTTASSAV
jgi:ketosteroid isomerase-like protein